jgi:predicted lipoprotein with Yx(FWY)xxD motif
LIGLNQRAGPDVTTGMTSVGTPKTRTAEGAARVRWAGLGLRLGGAGLLTAAGAIHLDLYLTGFRNVHIIGWLFLFQVIAAFGLAAIIAASGSRLAAAAGALFALSTLGGYLLSVWVGLFGFREVRTTAGIVAGVLEVAAFGVLAAYSLMPGRGAPSRPAAARIAARLEALTPLAAKGAAALTVLAAALLVVGLTTATAPQAATSASGGGSLRAATIGGHRVLTNSRGFTLYLFAPDSATASKCYGSCTAYWPVVKGPVTAGPGVTGTIGTIRRTDGSLQATYDRHPLYTYIGDSARGQDNGNNLDLSGGFWYDVTVSR